MGRRSEYRQFTFGLFAIFIILFGFMGKELISQEKKNKADVERYEKMVNEEGKFKLTQKILDEDRENYADEIRLMQDLIRRITELSADVEASEYKNKEYAKARFANIKKDLREVKKSGDVVSSYYRNMMAHNKVDDPAFLDKKK